MSAVNNLHNVRKNGRFIKKKVLSRELKALEAKEKKLTAKRQRLISKTMAATPAVEFDSKAAEAKDFANSVMDGRRIIDTLTNLVERNVLSRLPPGLVFA